MSEPEENGFHYDVDERKLRVFQSQPLAERLRWLEETRETLWQLASVEIKKSWERLRGKKFVSYD